MKSEVNMDKFVSLMRRYCLDYTNRHDVSQCESIMTPDYTLRMGQHVLVGRDDKYIPAASAQFKQFPGLCLTVHQIITNGERLALWFSEHGASHKHDGQLASWSGIGLYAWDGSRLVSNWVEQDYYSRQSQLGGADADVVERPAIDPWGTLPIPAVANNESIVRDYVSRINFNDSTINIDDSWLRQSEQPTFAEFSVEIDDIFSAGDSIAVRATMSGRYTGGLRDCESYQGLVVKHYFVGILNVQNNKVASGRIITDRLGLVRRMGAELQA